MSDLSLFRRIIRGAACALLPTALVLVSATILAVQFRELAQQKEILSLSSFVILLSFSALAFNWCRISPTLATEATLRVVYQGGIDLFLASMLALVSAFFAWLQMQASVASWIDVAFFLLHWVFLLLSVLLFLAAAFSLIRTARRARSESL